MHTPVLPNPTGPQAGQASFNCHSSRPASPPVNFPVFNRRNRREIQRSPAPTSSSPHFIRHSGIRNSSLLPRPANPSPRPVSTAKLATINSASPEKSPASQAEQAEDQRSPHRQGAPRATSLRNPSTARGTVRPPPLDCLRTTCISRFSATPVLSRSIGNQSHPIHPIHPGPSFPCPGK
jgi:hypothetical protein